MCCAYNPKDYYFHKAKKENYAARSAFKIEEIDQRFRLIRGGDHVLDLGAAPGSWSQYASRRVGPRGRVLGADLQPIKVTLTNALFVVADVLDPNPDGPLPLAMKEGSFRPEFDVVLSDMAPKTVGVKITDQVRSFELSMMAIAVADKKLRKGGHFVCKLFHSEEFEKFRAELRKRFEKVEILRPRSTRTESKEIFLIGIKYRGATAAAP
ncbi:MAG: RlmE family RNA methyltransferase [Bdellovibrionota bacterium]